MLAARGLRVSWRLFLKGVCVFCVFVFCVCVFCVCVCVLCVCVCVCVYSCLKKRHK